MPITVTCSGCKGKFTVSDKFAGRKGPCPKCKAEITIPAISADKVQIHEPEQYAAGGKDVKGRAVLQPIPRSEFKPTQRTWVLVLVASVLALAAAFVIGQSGPWEGAQAWLVYGLGLLIVSTPVVAVGYSFFQAEDPLAVYVGRRLWIRSAICAAIYAGLWGAFAATAPYVAHYGYWIWFVVPAPFLAVAALSALGTLDLEFGNGFFHACFYVIVTFGLSFVAHVPLPGQAPPKPAPPARAGTATHAPKISATARPCPSSVA